METMYIRNKTGRAVITDKKTGINLVKNDNATILTEAEYIKLKNAEIKKKGGKIISKTDEK